MLEARESGWQEGKKLALKRTKGILLEK